MWQGPEGSCQQPVRNWGLLPKGTRVRNPGSRSSSPQPSAQMTAALADSLPAISWENLSQNHSVKLPLNSWPTETVGKQMSAVLRSQVWSNLFYNNIRLMRRYSSINGKISDPKDSKQTQVQTQLLKKLGLLMSFYVYFYVSQIKSPFLHFIFEGNWS